MKKALFIATALLVAMASAAQDIHGTVTDASGQPLALANVVLLQVKDSAFVSGTATQDDGSFSIAQPAVPVFARISFLGYKTTDVAAKADMGRITLEEDANLLGEVTIKEKNVRTTAEGLTVTVKGTSLARLGFAEDVLRHLPLVSGKDGDFTVFGRGTPLIYVNNRLVRDNEELKQISSDNIRSVSVITNPGAEYDATVNAVIRITLARPQGEGFGGLFNAGAAVERRLSHNAGANITYRHGGLDIAASLMYNANDGEANQTTTRTHDNRMESESTELSQKSFN